MLAKEGQILTPSGSRRIHLLVASSAGLCNFPPCPGQSSRLWGKVLGEGRAERGIGQALLWIAQQGAACTYVSAVFTIRTNVPCPGAP